MNAAFPDVCESLGYSAVHERLRRKGNLSTFNPGFQQIAHIETDLLADVPRDDHLIFALYGDECHGIFQFDVHLNRTSGQSVRWLIWPGVGTIEVNMELAIRIQIEELPEGVYLATSDELPCLVAQGRTVAEALDIARDVARKLIEARRERKGEVSFPTAADRHDYMIAVAA
jgi:predicted RNase H-like HicB family nuclease